MGKQEDKYSKKLDDLSGLLDMKDPEVVLTEVKGVMALAYPEMSFKRLDRSFKDVLDLFRGHYPGYRACNTDYHDLKHTTDVLLAASRLLHGTHLHGKSPLSASMAEACLLAALFHDTGYIQGAEDANGTGAKYTLDHVERSAEFVGTYGAGPGKWPAGLAEVCGRLIMATKLTMRFEMLGCPNEEELRAARLAFSADILGQLADRVYLEKLLFLYREFVEGGIMGFGSEKDLLDKTIGFYGFIRNRLEEEAHYSAADMKAHFKSRWGVDRDLYTVAMENNIAYLTKIIRADAKSYRGQLKRDGLVRKLTESERMRGIER